MAGAQGFFKKATCEFCCGTMYGLRGAYFPKDNPRKGVPRGKREAHDHMRQWQLWSIYLDALNTTLKSEIRFAARKGKA